MLHEALENISVKNHKSLRNVKSLIDLHCQIILSSENIENLFSYIALMQLLCNTLIICCIGFLIIVVSNIYRYYFHIIIISIRITFILLYFYFHTFFFIFNFMIIISIVYKSLHYSRHLSHTRI